MKNIKSFFKSKDGRFVTIWTFLLVVLYFIQRYFIPGGFFGNFITNSPAIYTGILFSIVICFTARTEGFLYYYKVHSGKGEDINEHPTFVVFRVALLIMTWIMTSWDIALCYWAMIPFLHDGAYYKHRNRLDKETYKKGWLDQSKSSKAIMTPFQPPIVRAILFAIALSWIFIKSWY